MQFPGLTDLVPTILGDAKKCTNCGTASNLHSNICLCCSFRGAMAHERRSSTKISFKAALAQVSARDIPGRFGDYEILDEIGRGGMGIIYRARERHSRRIVAVKCVLRYHADSDQTLSRFRREAETATKLDHPNIVPIYYVGQCKDGLPFFVMKFAPCGNLFQARQDLYGDPRASVLLITKVARAIKYAHFQGILHRDLKPSNILLSSEWEPLISDFGLAKWMETLSDLTRTLTIFGTPGYIAPEQAMGPAVRLTFAADIYSIGAILFELLAGRPPFIGEHALAVIAQAAAKPAPKLRSIAPHLDRDLETICARCLEQDPSARYSSADNLARDLESWLESRPIIAQPVGVSIHFWRWFRRNRTLAGAVCFSFLVGMALLAWQIGDRQRQAAAHEQVLAARSVAVLPILDLDELMADEASSHAIANTVKSKIDPIGPARIRTVQRDQSDDWATPEKLRKAGQVAKARTVLTGTQRTVQGRKRLALRLLNSATGDTLLSGVSDANGLGDAIETSANQFGQPLYSLLIAKEWPNGVEPDAALQNSAAYDAITAGRELLLRHTANDLDRATALFEKALQLTPNSALAHACLAIADIGRAHYVADSGLLERGEKEARRALELAPLSTDARRALAAVFYQKRQLSSAIEEGMRTIEIAGLEEKTVRFIGMAFHAQGRLDKALAWYQLAGV